MNKLAALYLLLAAAGQQCCGDTVCADPASAPTGIFPPPKSLVRTEYSLGCTLLPNTTFDNSNFADGNGPRGVTSAGECCSLCAGLSGCKFWSFNVDSSIPGVAPGFCKWGQLAWCCFLHTSNTNQTHSSRSEHQFGAKGNWTSGVMQPRPAQPRHSAPPGTARTEFSMSPQDTAIVATDASLQPLAGLLSDQVFALSGLRFNVSSKFPAQGHPPSVMLSLMNQTWPGQHWGSAASEQYSLVVDGNGVRLSCADYTGCAWGVSTLAQSLCVRGVEVQTVAVPCMNVTDGPDVGYRGVLVDVARTRVTLPQLYDAVVWCGFFKIPLLHLHLTDDHGWSFPSQAFPLLGSQNIGFRGPAVQLYDTAALQALVDFAALRGVSIVPELEGPGHSGAMRRSDRFFQGEGGDNPAGGGVMNVANDSLYTAMDTLVSEISAVFHTSPYFHIGCDETSTPASLPGYALFAKEHNITSPNDLFAYYVKAMVDSVTKHGKKAVLWGPAQLARLHKGDAVVMIWDGGDAGAQAALAQGLDVINCPNGVGNLSSEFYHNIFDFAAPSAASSYATNRHSGPSPSIKPTSMMLGVQLNMWEEGWGYGLVDYGAAAVGRAGAGWWGYTWPRNTTAGTNSSALQTAYASALRTHARLRPSCPE
eukprot:m.327371 g.327371  ORF g.327371 m.327371 type:complete len:647 (-) comp49279_c0_seq1:20-1960(-)